MDDSTGRCFTYRELGELSTQLAAGLSRLGFRAGDVAGLHSENKPEMALAFNGVMFSGGTVVFAKANLTRSK